ncbi:hypothetical protein O181_037265 [Austropuccinia psidii MF-1]|uniref:Uncharacterized protein n=1 Tax=Austropuccinia psidii MF-1 TaxID=1389203 RepID=A0A9Q3D7X3_9BASI|nr:hypothetical protein [Austropuccinia psidii MF-1]
MISDVKPDSPGQPLSSISWRSNRTDCILQLLDEGYTQLAITARAKRDHNNTLQKLTPDLHISKAPGFGNIPNKIPSNWVAPYAMASPTEVGKSGIKLQEPVYLSSSNENLRSISRRKTFTHSSFI